MVYSRRSKTILNCGIAHGVSIFINSRMTSELRGMSLPPPTFRIAPLPEGLHRVRGYHGLQTFFPTLGKLVNVTTSPSSDVWLDCKWMIHSLDISGVRGPCRVVVGPTTDMSGEVNGRNAYVKVTHLLDPVRWMQGKYPTVPQDTTTQKLQDPCNQAYVEAIASYALGRLAEGGASPHFNAFYGAFCANADIYRYNIGEEFQSYRHERWFWDEKENGRFSIQISNPSAPDEPIPDSILSELMTPGSIFSDSGSDEEEVVDAADIDDKDASIHSGGDSDMSFAEEDTTAKSKKSKKNKQEEDEGNDGDDEAEDEDDDEDEEDEDDDEDEDEDEGPDYQIYSEMKNFPVMLIVIDKNEGTMDDLLDDYTSIGCTPDSENWEVLWSAWMFQILAGLSVAQAVIGFTHNDLHTNNIVWTKTDEEFLFYKTHAGAVFKVPTFGKLFKIIDFGRSIFTINGQQFISDDFKAGNDADGQYRFPPLVEQSGTLIPPNPSFDLARLAVSLFESIFPDPPPEKEGGVVLSSEEGNEVNETESPLFNCMWKWMLDDNGENILINPDGSEKFPDFDLYKHIAEKVHGAIPSRQFVDPAFDRFQVDPSTVGVKCWSLFC